MAVSCPHTFFLGRRKILIFFDDIIADIMRQEFYPKNLSTVHLLVWGSKKQQRRGWDYSNFTKGETFLVF